MLLSFLRLEAYQEAYLKEKAAKVAHYQRALAEQVCMYVCMLATMIL